MDEILSNWENQLIILLDVSIAVILCAAIGKEREKSDKPAGLRTNMIVGGISCFFVSICNNINNYIVESGLNNNVDVNTDPIRVLQAILVGVSFIGAGTVLKTDQGDNIKYLTTAATILFSSGVGIAVAMHAYIVAVGLTGIILLINLLNSIATKVK